MDGHHETLKSLALTSILSNPLMKIVTYYTIIKSSLDPSNLKVTVTILQASDKCRSKLSVNNTHHPTLFTCHLSSCHITTESGLSQAVGYSLFSQSVIVDKIRTPPCDTHTIHICVCLGLNSAKRDSLRGILY